MHINIHKDVHPTINLHPNLTMHLFSSVSIEICSIHYFSGRVGRSRVGGGGVLNEIKAILAFK